MNGDKASLDVNSLEGLTMIKSVLAVLVAVIFTVTVIAIGSTEPQAWVAPEAPSQIDGPYAQNTRLASVSEWLSIPEHAGPEFIEFNKAGHLITGYNNGAIVVVDPATQQVQALANTGGRPLGLRSLSTGELIVADADKGLLSVSPDGMVNVLVNRYKNYALGLVDDVTVSKDGKIAYFTEASTKYPLHDYLTDVIEHGANGRVFSLDLKTGELNLIADRLYFPNGIVLMPDEQSVLVLETSMYRAMRVWVRGPKIGQREVWADNFPGFPDNITLGKNGRVWIALASPRNRILDVLSEYPRLRGVLTELPEWALPKPEYKSQVLVFNQTGELLDYLAHDRGQGYAPITTAQEKGDWLYLGSFQHPAIARVNMAVLNKKP